MRPPDGSRTALCPACGRASARRITDTPVSGGQRLREPPTPTSFEARILPSTWTQALAVRCTGLLGGGSHWHGERRHPRHQARDGSQASSVVSNETTGKQRPTKEATCQPHPAAVPQRQTPCRPFKQAGVAGHHFRMHASKRDTDALRVRANAAETDGLIFGTLLEDWLSRVARLGTASRLTDRR